MDNVSSGPDPVDGQDDNEPGSPGERSGGAPSKPRERLPSPRTVVAGVTGLVAVIALLAGVLGFWTLRAAADSDRFESRVETLLVREDISDALARRVVAEVADAIALDQALDEAVPEVLRPAVNVLLAGVRSRVELRLGEQLRSDRFVELVGAAAGRAHGVAVQVLEGDDVVDGVAIVDDEVRINLLPLTAAALGLFQDVGLFADVEIPELERGGDPDEQRAELSAAFGRDVPADFGEVVVFSSEALDDAGATVDRVRDVLVLAKRAAWLFVLVGLVLGAVAIWLSVDRWRSAAWLVAGLFVSALVVRFVAGRASDELPNAVEQPGARATIAELADGLERSINNTLLAVSVAGLTVLIGAVVINARYPRPTA